MKKQSIALIMLLALSTTLPIFALKTNAYPVTQTPSTNPTIIHWENLTAYGELKWNPEYLMLQTMNAVHTNMTVIIQGKDAYGQPIEAKANLPGTKDNTPIINEYWVIFTDTHTVPPKPVAFSEITGIFQQNGTDNDAFQIYTLPVRDVQGRTNLFQQYLGQYSTSDGWEPGLYVHDTPSGPYVVTQGQGLPYTVQNVPVEPENPDPIKIVVNWVDTNTDPSGNPRVVDLYPQPDEIGLPDAITTQTLWIEGLDQTGLKIIKSVDISPTTGTVDVDCTYTWSTVCKVWGGSPQDSYYIFTHPKPSRLLFKYYVIIDHVTISPDCYDILAYPDRIDGAYPEYPGVTNITVALKDIDGNIVHAGDVYDEGISGEDYIVVNFYTSGGKIQPSSARMWPCNATVVANLTADTNPRTINVTVDINVPPCSAGWHSAMNLFAWTEMTFDGINSVNSYKWGDWPVHTMHWGYNTTYPNGHPNNNIVLDVPPKPWLPPELGGPNATGIKLDGPIYEVSIPLFVGCNLISSPVHPLMCGKYYNGYPTSVSGVPTYPTIDNKGIPMDLLFNYTSARDCIEAIWWYTADGPSNDPTISGTWKVYVPGVTSSEYFTDGIGYWIKAEKPCTLEISGVFMENGPFTPPTYKLRGNTWSLVGVTSVTGISLDDYLESTMGSTGIKAAGPVWMYINPGLNPDGTSPYDGHPITTGWSRNPQMVWPGEAFWIYNKVPNDLYLAP